MTKKKSKGLSLISKAFIALGIVFIIAIGITFTSYYLRYYGPNVNEGAEYLYIRTGSDFKDVMDSIKTKDMLKDTTTFRWAAENMDYMEKVKPGRYHLEKGMSNRKLINMLKSGNQEPVKLRFQNLRMKENLAGFVSKKLELDSTKLVSLLDSDQLIHKYGFNKDNIYAMFIPNSYEVYWNTDADQFFERMNDEYQKFWTDERKSKAEKIGLSPIQVSILAAIVDAEALHDDEMPTIAGLYMNRYKKGTPLQADPTVIFANKDFTIKRVLNKYLSKESPYNTYRHSGLPPGPIMMPSINAIDAVLNYKKHNYIYMCAKEDFSGYHNFAVTAAEHQANARRFQQALDKLNIKK
ncbi:MAG TPA: endolytic transglycosylase MltG [Sphingobacteriaceae bacterium]|nr:endolytic transglycosylase MltG [Sphingobacteriaceae bacterium]